MSQYRISNSMYKRKQERKNRAYLLLCMCSLLQLLIIILCVTSGRDGIILACVLEPLLLYIVWRYLRHDIRALTYRNRSGIVLSCDIDRYIDRSISGGGNRGRGVRYNHRAKINYTLYISVDEGKVIKVPIPDRDAYLSYKKGDEVMLISCLPYPIITNRTPSQAICPQCASLLHYEDGACHRCGLEDIYPDFCSIPKWERK